MPLIAVEEHFMIPELAQAAQGFLAGPQARGSGWHEATAALEEGARQEAGARLLDLGEARLAAMDAAGIERQVLLVTTVGNPQMLAAAEGTELARLANDRLAEVIAAHPDRFSGLACVAPQDPHAAAAELERAINTLGLRGLVINSNISGEYLDEDRFAPLLEAAAALSAPIYIHPTLLPPDAIRPYLRYGLMAAVWGFAAEASVHALRLILSGAFDRFPSLQVVLGHLGEHIPFSLPRIDSNHLETKAAAPSLQRLPSEYFRENFHVTTSGMNLAPASIRFCVDLLGAERVLFAADYPYEPIELEVQAIKELALSDRERDLIEHANAERLFRL
ncbi:MAG TPA: amidohydrolase family protein [Solirubrobacteraceae bacterium]|jgi:2,3-dihydroxybenzoate decarboxylase